MFVLEIWCKINRALIGAEYSSTRLKDRIAALLVFFLTCRRILASRSERPIAIFGFRIKVKPTRTVMFLFSAVHAQVVDTAIVRVAIIFSVVTFNFIFSRRFRFRFVSFRTIRWARELVGLRGCRDLSSSSSRGSGAGGGSSGGSAFNGWFRTRIRWSTREYRRPPLRYTLRRVCRSPWPRRTGRWWWCVSGFCKHALDRNGYLLCKKFTIV